MAGKRGRKNFTRAFTKRLRMLRNNLKTTIDKEITLIFQTLENSRS